MKYSHFIVSAAMGAALVLTSPLALSKSTQHPKTNLVSMQASTQHPSQRKIHLNKADARQLAKVMRGVGKKRAAAIVAYRDKNGPFKSLSDLAKVRGIGKTFVAKREQVWQTKLILN